MSRLTRSRPRSSGKSPAASWLTETGKVTCATEAARLNREGVPAPSDRRAQLYARPMKGHLWTAKTVKHILTSEAALGYLMHDGRPVTGADGQADPHRRTAVGPSHPGRAGGSDRAQAQRQPRPEGRSAPVRIAFCGNCGARLYLTGRRADSNAYGCTARVRGIPASGGCKPAPTIGVAALDAQAGAWFLARYGAGEVMRKVYDPGTGHAAQIAELEATQTRLRDDRQAGLYDSPKDCGMVPRRVSAARGGNCGAEGASGAEAGNPHGAHGPYHRSGMGSGR